MGVFYGIERVSFGELEPCLFDQLAQKKGVVKK